MRFGKHKGCEFLYEDCSDKFRNEYFKYNENKNTPSCSSGRQSRTYRVENGLQYNINNGLYNRYKNGYVGPLMVEYCYISDTQEIEMRNNYFSGNCKLGDEDYGTYIYDRPIPWMIKKRYQII